MGLLGARDDEQTGGVAVEAVHDAGALGVAAGGGGGSGRRGGTLDEQLGERVLAVALGWVHDDAGGLVDDEQVLVLVGDREGLAHASALGDVAAARFAAWRAWSITRNRVSTPKVIDTSARLNGGQPSGSLMKSVTEPTRTRSTTLPMAPPISIPVGSQISGSLVCRAKYTSSPSRATPIRIVIATWLPGRKPKATPWLRVLTELDARQHSVFFALRDVER